MGFFCVLSSTSYCAIYDRINRYSIETEKCVYILGCVNIQTGAVELQIKKVLNEEIDVTEVPSCHWLKTLISFTAAVDANNEWNSLYAVAVFFRELINVLSLTILLLTYSWCSGHKHHSCHVNYWEYTVGIVLECHTCCCLQEIVGLRLLGWNSSTFLGGSLAR